MKPSTIVGTTSSGQATPFKSGVAAGASQPAATPFAGISLFSGLNASQIKRIEKHLQTRVLPPHTIFIHKGESADGLFFVCEGSVKVFIPQCEKVVGHSKEVITAICGKGETLGEIDLADGAGHTASVATLEESRLWWISSEDFWRCHDAMPQLGRNLCRLLTRRIRWCTAMQEALATLHLSGKVAYCLLLLARDHGVCQSNGDVLVPLHLSQSDIAVMAGSARECVNRTFADFRNQHLIRHNPGEHLLIRDEAALRQYCAGLMPEKVVSGCDKSHTQL